MSLQIFMLYSGAYALMAKMLFCLLIAPSAQAQAIEQQDLDTPETRLQENEIKAAERYPIDWTLGVEGQSFEDDFNRDLLTKFKLGLDAELKLTSYFRVFGQTQLQSEQGQSQGLDNEPNRRSSGIYLIEAGGELQHRFGPELSAHFTFGALKVYDDTTSMLLLSSQTFPGLQERLEWKTSRSLLSLSALQSIPTSTTLSTKAVEKEPLPYYLSQSIYYSQNWTKNIKTILNLTHFQFVDLPDKVGFDSRLFGNSINTLTINRGEFLYGFEGYQPTFEVAGSAGRLTSGFRTEYLINTRAPNGQDQGLLNAIWFLYPLSANTSLRIDGGVYENQSDSSPAYYNTWNHGHNNVRGEFARVELDFEKPRFSVTAYYTQFEVIDPNPYQSDAQYFRLSLETGYDDAL